MGLDIINYTQIKCNHEKLFRGTTPAVSMITYTVLYVLYF